MARITKPSVPPIKHVEVNDVFIRSDRLSQPADGKLDQLLRLVRRQNRLLEQLLGKKKAMKR